LLKLAANESEVTGGDHLYPYLSLFSITVELAALVAPPALLSSVIEYRGLSALLDARFSFRDGEEERERESFILDKI